MTGVQTCALPIYTLKPGVPKYGTNISTIFGPGALKLVDQNKDGIINSNDKIILGNGLPISSGGFDVVMRYKGFDCTANFNFSYGNDIYNANNLVNTANPNNYTHLSLSNLSNSDNRFKYINPTNYTTTWIKDPVELYEANKNATIWSPSSIATVQLTSWDIEDGSFLRFNNLTVGYTFTKQLLKKIGIDQLRIYTTAYNLWVWTNYSGNDPEVSTGSSSITPGIDWGSYPRSRSISFGLNLTL